MSLWLIRAGSHGEFEPKFLEEDRVYVTWLNLAHDLHKLETRESLIDLLEPLDPGGKLKKRINHASQIWPFAHTMQKGDWVVLPLKTQQSIYIGEITSDYHFEPKGPNPFYHWRSVKWIGEAIPRQRFGQDLLHSFGAFLTICRIQRNNAEARLKAMKASGWGDDPGKKGLLVKAKAESAEIDDEELADDLVDLEQQGLDRIATMIQAKFAGHGLTRLVEGILKAQGYTTYLSPEGADGGADILAGMGALGFGTPQLCVEVKSELKPIDRPTVDKLLGAMSKFNAPQGLFVAWGGFKGNVQKELAQSFFKVRLWDPERTPRRPLRPLRQARRRPQSRAAPETHLDRGRTGGGVKLPPQQEEIMSQDTETTMATQSARSPEEFHWLNSFLTSIRSFAPDESMILEAGNVADLYHYTDLGGLKGIIEGGDLWLTHLRFSNDNEEFTHRKQIVREVLDQRKQNASPDQEGFLKRLGELLDQPVADGVYICCFCEKDNLLSQWRGYGANGSGVCIKFDKNRFSHLTGADCNGGLLRLWKVFYPIEQQRKIISKAIDFAWHYYGLDDDQRARHAAEAIQFFIPTFKNPDFAEEQEWRLIFTPEPALPVKPAFRTGRNMLIPYYGLRSLGWGDNPLPITGVCVGPGTQKDINAQSVQMLLDTRHYNGQRAYPNVKVEVSKTPYRG